MASRRHVRVAIIGTGFAGLGMAIQLRRHGIDDFLLVERADDVGGTWRDNTYPGAACDIRSDLYSFSFFPKPDWANHYAQQPEILEYLRSAAEHFDLYPQILFGAELTSASWDDDELVWTIQTSRESFTAAVLVAGAGPLIDPKWPEIIGLDTFTGPRFHSARWDHGIDLAGKTIAVIGTGASSIQFVPELQKIAARVSVFQRSAPWILPRADAATSDLRRSLFSRVPLLQRASRRWIFTRAEAQFAGFRYARVGKLIESLALRYLRSAVEDPALRAKLTPTFRLGCKRVLISSAFYRAIAKPNVELIDEPIGSISGDSVRTTYGTTRHFDVLICGTGFNATKPPVARLLNGRGGVLLADRWSPHMSALRGTTVQDFPNLFLLVGPNTALGHNSIIYIIEAQLGYILRALAAMDRRNAVAIEPTPAAQSGYNEKLQRSLANAVWSTGGCTSFYLDDAGMNTTLWPHRAALFRRAVSRFRAVEYTFTPATIGAAQR
jgi:cation diffusion facilitator CzcD-associated flavoprotein CzcO